MKISFSQICVLCLCGALSAIGALPELVEPDDGATVSTLTDSQRRFITMAPMARRVKFADFGFRAREMGLPSENVGGIPRRTFWPKTVKLAWKQNAGEVTVKVADIAKKQVVFEKTTADSSVYVDNLENAAEYEWTVVNADGAVSRRFKTEDQPVRLVRFPGVNNVRDLGGKRGFNGLRIRQGLLFRSAGLADIDDAKYVRDRFGIRSDIDLRGTNECAGITASPLGGDVKWINCPLSEYGAVMSRGGKEQFAKAFRLLLGETNYPAVFHGAKGDDRTGSLSFILLGVLGCDGNSIALDWEVSAFRNRAPSWNHSRFDSLEAGLTGFYGRSLSFTECFETYVLDCGFSVEDIAKFRSIMLESTDENGGKEDKK